ncbi:unnamed protein product [Oppiella nova]|uniref:Clock n=1 Tax=Oppiella nova TaxID=334625 RepID=A0A7R9M682_9ACAR|nr:unnamed protein product [Oppiella nova]CAG2170362.1 unnamed protein product [Oppiella nova]
MNDLFDINTTEELDDEKDDNKRKSRNLSEKKRRDQFNQLINELCAVINYHSPDRAGSSGAGSAANKHKADKSSILRASIAFLKTQSELMDTKASDESRQQSRSIEGMAGEGTGVQTTSIFSWKPSFLANDEFVHLMLEALDSFVIIIDGTIGGKIIYLSETVYPLLGLSYTKLNHRLTGDDLTDRLTIYDLIHDEEKRFVEEFLSREQLVSKDNSRDTPLATILVHFRDHDIDNRSAAYRLVRLIGSFSRLTIDEVSAPCFVGIGRLQTPKFLRELHFQASDGRNNEFISRNSLEWKFLYLDHRACPIIGYLPFEILGTSGYDYYHWDDLDDIVSGHERLMRSGESTSCLYRFLTKSHQWIWLRTDHYIAYHHWTAKPEYVVCRHAVVDESVVADHKSRVIMDRVNRKSQPNIAVSSCGDNNDGSATVPQPSSTAGPMCWSADSYTDGQTTGEYVGVNGSQLSADGSQSAMSTDSKSEETPNKTDRSLTTKKGSPLKEFLRQKHRLLENQIRRQQEELRRVTEQLDLVGEGRGQDTGSH